MANDDPMARYTCSSCGAVTQAKPGLLQTKCIGCHRDDTGTMEALRRWNDAVKSFCEPAAVSQAETNRDGRPSERTTLDKIEDGNRLAARMETDTRYHFFLGYAKAAAESADGLISRLRRRVDELEDILYRRGEA